LAENNGGNNKSVNQGINPVKADCWSKDDQVCLVECDLNGRL